MEEIHRVAVLLPTYNGGRFLAAQLNSLLAQTMDNFVVVTRDDGSSDESREIIRAYQSKHPQHFHVVESDGRNLGPCGNFSFLMQYTLDHKRELNLESAYMMLCDQDDVWEMDKIAIEMQVMEEMEAGDPDLPILVHSDLKVVSDSEELIAESFIRYQGLNASRNSLRGILLSNTVTGATALMNERLIRKSLPIPEAAMMHDWWLALVAAAFGSIKYIPEQLVSYRQHDRNVLGARQHRPLRNLNGRSLLNLFALNSNPILKPLAFQAQAFASLYGGELGMVARLRVKLVSKLDTDNPFIQRLVFRLLRL